METGEPYVVNLQWNEQVEEDHLATASELLADLVDNIHANPSHWVAVAQCHALLAVAQELRRMGRGQNG